MIRLHDAIRRAREGGSENIAQDPLPNTSPLEREEGPVVIPWEFGRDIPSANAESDSEGSAEVAEDLEEPRRGPRRIALVLAVVAIAAVVAYAVTRTAALPASDLRLSGIVAANQFVVASNLPGKIERLTVIEGASVKAGDPLAQIDRAELVAERQNQLALIEQLSAKLQQAREIVSVEGARGKGQVASAGADLQAIRSQRDEAIATVDQSRSEVARSQNLLGRGLISRQAAEQTETELKVAEARLAALEDRVSGAEADEQLAHVNARNTEVAAHDIAQIQAQIRQAEAQLEQIAARIAQGDIRAPRGGTVSLIVSREGEIVRAGDPIVTIVDLDDVWVRADLEESYMNRVTLGQTLDVELASGSRLQGKVTQIEPEAQFATQRDVSRVKRDIRTFGVKVSLPNSNRRVHVGMTAFVTLPPTASAAGVLAK